jgi:hypothetical protein
MKKGKNRKEHSSIDRCHESKNLCEMIGEGEEMELGQKTGYFESLWKKWE